MVTISGLKLKDTVTWDADNGDNSNYVTKTNVRYGTRTDSADAGKPEEDPTRAEDALNSYEFKAWSPDPADAANLFVTADAVYQATYEETPLASAGHKIIITDYTKGGATTTLDADATYTSGQKVTFDVTAPIATVLAIHEDATEETKDSQDGTFTRLYCTATDAEDQYQFSVTMGDEDMYLVMAYKGDVDLNGRINTRDVQAVSQVAAKNEAFNSLKALAGDVDANGRNNTRDSHACSQVAAKNEKHTCDMK